MNISEAQTKVDQWIKKYGVRYFNELTNMSILMEEVGELASLFAREYGEQSYKKTKKHSTIEEEMGDVFFVLICLANQTGIDLTTALQKNMEKKTKRDSNRHINNPRLL